MGWDGLVVSDYVPEERFNAGIGLRKEDVQKVMDKATADLNSRFMMRYEPTLDLQAPQFHPLPQPPTLLPKPRR